MPEPFYIGQTVWNKKREDFVMIVSYAADPMIVLVEPNDFPGEYEEVSIDLLEKSIFWEHNHPAKEKQ